MLVVLKQVDDDKQHLMDVVPLFVVHEHVVDKLLVLDAFEYRAGSQE